MSQFNRTVELSAGSVDLTDSEVEFGGFVEFSEDWSDDVSRISILNLSQGTVSALSEVDEIELRAGYGDEVSILLQGVVRRVLTEDTQGGTRTTIIVGTGMREFQKTFFSKSYLNEVSPSQVAQDVVSRIQGVQVGNLDFGGEPYPSHTVARSALREVDRLKRDFGRVAYLRDLQLFIEDPSMRYSGRVKRATAQRDIKSIRRGFSRERDQHSINIRTRLDSDLFTGSTVEVMGTNLDGVYRTISGVHNLDDWVTNIDVVET